MKIQTLLLTMTLAFTGNAYAQDAELPNMNACLANARLPHDRALCQALDNCERNRCETGMDCNICKLEAKKGHRHAHDRHLSNVAWTRPITPAPVQTIRSAPAVMVPTETIVEPAPSEGISVNVTNNTAPVEVVVEEDVGEGYNSDIDAARSNSTMRADGTGWAISDHPLGAL